jgi:hypothetical protein
MKKIFVALFVLAGVAFSIWYFILAPEEDKMRVRKIGYGAKYEAKRAVDSVTKSVEPAGGVEEARLCREKIRRIESAKRAVAQRMGLTHGSEIPMQELYSQMGITELPRCPAGGVYEIMPVGTMVRCSRGTNGVGDPNDDHIVIAW